MKGDRHQPKTTTTRNNQYQNHFASATIGYETNMQRSCSRGVLRAGHGQQTSRKTKPNAKDDREFSKTCSFRHQERGITSSYSSRSARRSQQPSFARSAATTPVRERKTSCCVAQGTSHTANSRPGSPEASPESSRSKTVSEKTPCTVPPPSRRGHRVPYHRRRVIRLGHFGFGTALSLWLPVRAGGRKPGMSASHSVLACST